MVNLSHFQPNFYSKKWGSIVRNQVYRTDDRDCSVSFHHSGSDNYDGEISSQINQAMAMTDWRDVDLGA